MVTEQAESAGGEGGKREGALHGRAQSSSGTGGASNLSRWGVPEGRDTGN